MSRAADPTKHDFPASPTPERRLCPFCGTAQDRSEVACTRCGLEDSPATRQATRARIGPWQVLQSRNPAAPGMKFSTLLSLIRRGQITARSVVRGPTTQQFWTVAAQVKGISREFGLCYNCNAEIETTANICPHCQKLQEPPINPDVLVEGPATAPQANTTVEFPSAAPPQPRRRRAYVSEPTVNVDMDPPISPSSLPARQAPEYRGATAAGESSHLPSAPGRTGHPNPGILTARELATAFQLEFNPDSATSAGAASTKPPRKRRRVRKTLALLILLGAIGSAALFYLRPDLRDRSMEWARNTGASLKARYDAYRKEHFPPEDPWMAEGESVLELDPDKAIQVTPAPASPPSAKPPPTADIDPMMSKPVLTKPAPSEANESSPAAAATAQRSEQPKQQEKPQPSPPTAGTGMISKPSSSSPQSSSDAAAQASATESAAGSIARSEAEAEPVNEEALLDMVRTLRNAGLDAEARGDYATALTKYEAISKLPKSVWPGDLQTSIDFVRSKAK